MYRYWNIGGEAGVEAGGIKASVFRNASSSAVANNYGRKFLRRRNCAMALTYTFCLRRRAICGEKMDPRVQGFVLVKLVGEGETPSYKPWVDEYIQRHDEREKS